MLGAVPLLIALAALCGELEGCGGLGLDLGVYGAPETYFVDGDGTVRYRHVGVIDERIWEERLQPIYREMQGEGRP